MAKTLKLAELVGWHAEPAHMAIVGRALYRPLRDDPQAGELKAAVLQALYAAGLCHDGHLTYSQTHTALSDYEALVTTRFRAVTPGEGRGYVNLLNLQHTEDTSGRVTGL